ncbi:MAG: hypothetical protein ACXVDD_03465 [Polyangia bacterium]
MAAILLFPTAMIRRALSRVAGFWQRRADLSRGPTYEAARAELGGAPWREVPKSTDAWSSRAEAVAARPAPAASRRLRCAGVTVAAAAVTALLFLVARAAPAATPLPAAVAATVVSPAGPAPRVETISAAAVTPSAPERPTPATAPIRQAARARAAHHGLDKQGKKHARR